MHNDSVANAECTMCLTCKASDQIGNLNLDETSKDYHTIERLKKFCKLKNIITSGAFVMTIQRNRTEQYASLVVDMDRDTLHELYPQAFNKI